uniref:Cytidine and dCMP deaminase domain-containing protein 1 n=1 Tax=Monopterus albus TaxID=43700 RepID=A0A3Q3J322_MONAL
MEESDLRNRADRGESVPDRDTRDSSTQTDSKVQGHGPRLSKVNLFTLLSLWMELFPQEQPEEEDHSQIHGVGLVVVQDSKVVGLHCSGAELHAGQAAIIQHGTRLAGCQLYFSRRPCATCLKMIINAGVSQISFWPGDPEVSMLRSTSTTHSNSHSRSLPDCTMEEATLDAIVTERLKSNSRPHICVLLQPLAPGLAQSVSETSRECDFMERVTDDEPALNRIRHLKDFSRQFLVAPSQQHREILTHMHLENFCVEPYFSNLRHNMRELVEVLAAVAAGVPQRHHGFYRLKTLFNHLFGNGSLHALVIHIFYFFLHIKLISLPEDPKVGVGAVIWAKGQSPGFEGTGGMYLVGCGYNAYPVGSKYAEYPQMDRKQEDRQRRKYRYIIHAEQNAITFRSEQALLPTMMFVTKCPCDECVPLIRGAGISHIYTNDQDRDKDKGDISYLKFSSLKDVTKFIVKK